PVPRLDQYEILGELGRGGMGIVYKARHRNLHRLVALKLLRFADTRPEDRNRFQQEAEAVARLNHPNAVQIYDVGDVQGCPYLALEYCVGGTLADKVREGPLPPRDAAELVQRLARAVGYAHERGVIHRDLKPANVLLLEDGTPKVSDFGLAKRLE